MRAHATLSASKRSPGPSCSCVPSCASRTDRRRCQDHATCSSTSRRTCSSRDKSAPQHGAEPSCRTPNRENDHGLVGGIVNVIEVIASPGQEESAQARNTSVKVTSSDVWGLRQYLESAGQFRSWEIGGRWSMFPPPDLQSNRLLSGLGCR